MFSSGVLLFQYCFLIFSMKFVLISLVSYFPTIEGFGTPFPLQHMWRGFAFFCKSLNISKMKVLFLYLIWLWMGITNALFILKGFSNRKKIIMSINTIFWFSRSSINSIWLFNDLLLVFVIESPAILDFVFFSKSCTVFVRKTWFEFPTSSHFPYNNLYDWADSSS